MRVDKSRYIMNIDLFETGALVSAFLSEYDYAFSRIDTINAYKLGGVDYLYSFIPDNRISLLGGRRCKIFHSGVWK